MGCVIELLTHFGNGVRSFQTDNVRSVNKRAVKLLAFKFGGLKKKFDGWQHFKDSFTLSK